MAKKLIGKIKHRVVETMINSVRFEVVANPNTNSLFVYDYYRDVYIDVPVCENPNDLDEKHQIELEDICNTEYPNWLDDEEYFVEDLD